MINEIEILKRFLKFSLWNSDDVFEEFKKIDGATFRENPNNPKERFLFIEGSRTNKVVLVAHADTYFDESYFDESYDYGCIKHDILEEDGVIKSINDGEVGLGADDRAGCAMLWILRDSGHSILITDGEEHGQKGSVWLMDNHKDIADKLNQHQFMIQLDRKNSTDFKCYGVGTDIFRDFIREQTGYNEPDKRAYTDIVTLCRDICGVNFSIGYYNEHYKEEHINVKEWLNTLNVVRNLLSNEQLNRFELS